MKKIGEWIIDCAILVYGMAETKNNFLFLHGVTAAWGLSQILPSLNDKNEALKAIIYFISALIVVYNGQDCPVLEEKNLSSVTAGSWDELKKEIFKAVVDPHVYKLAHVCRSRFEQNPDETMRGFYIKAVHLGTYNDFTPVGITS